MKHFNKLFMLLALMMPFALLAQTYQSVPYFENFDSPVGSSPALPAGWVNYLTGSSGSGTFPCCYNYSGNARSGNYYFELESSNSTTELVATCEFANPANLMLDFYYCVNSSYAPALFEVGVMEDSTFVPVDTLTFVTVNSWNQYTHMVVPLSNYTGDGHRIAFRASHTGGQYTVFIDDMTIMNIPGCPYLPGDATATAVDSVSANLTWGDAISSAGYFLYLNNDSTWYNAYTNEYLFTGLTPNTAYSGFIYNTCDGTDTSMAVPFSFRTACGMPAFPMLETFEGNTGNVPSCWHVFQAYSSYPSLSSGAGRTGVGVNMYSYSNNVAIATPYLYAPINTLETKVWAQKSSSSYDDKLIVGYTSSVTDVNSLVAVDTITLSTQWTEYTVSFAGTGMTESGYIVFSKIGGGYGYVHLDDITIREVGNCISPSHLATTGTATGEISLSWLDTLNSSWEVVYGTPGFDPDTALNSVSFYEAYGTVSGLEDSITYDFYVRTDCGGEYSYWVGPISARPNLVPMTAGRTDTMSLCGGTITDDGGLFGNGESNTTSYMVVYPSEEGKTIALHGTANLMGPYTYYYNTLDIYEGVGTSGRLLGSWSNASGDSVNVASVVGPVTIKFVNSLYPGAGFELQVECLDAPNCVNPWNVNVTDVAGGTATVHWEYGSTTPASYFNITVTDTLSGTNLMFTADDTARSYAISGLDQTTTYSVSVTASCVSGYDSDPVSAWFTTTCFVGGELVVGDGNVSLTSHPINTYYKYSISQSIYDMLEVATLTDTIYGIKLYRMSGSNTSRNINVYIDTTSKTTFSGGSDFVVMDSSKMVFSGILNTQDGWNEITFPTPYVRPSATNNLIVTIDDNTGSYTSTSGWQGTGNLPNKTLYQYSDGTNWDPTTSLSINTTTNRPNILFVAPCANTDCVAPAVTMGDATTTSLTVNWVPGMSETQWTVEYKLHTDTTWTVAEATTSALTATITGLMANTEYDVRVGSICLIGTTPFSYVTGRTACGVMARASLPFTEGFEGISTGNMPSCWIRLATGTSGAGTFPCAYAHAPNAHNSSVYFELETSAGGTEIFALPAIDTIDGLTFDYYIATGGSYAPSTLEIGVVENDSVFVVLDTVDLSDCTGINSYVRKSYRINYTGLDARIAMRSSKSSSYTVFIDDISVYVPNPCDSVVNLAIDAIAADQIDIVWSDPNATGSYVVKIGTTNNPDAATDTYTTTDTTFSFTLLSANTTYYMFVYNDCGTGLSDVNMIVATTPCVAVDQFPWSDDFESGLSACYQQIYINGSHNWTVTTTSSNPSGAHSGSNVAAYTHTSSNTETMLVLPIFDFSSLTNGAQVSFYHTQVDWASDQDELYVYYRTSLTGDWTLIQSYTDAIVDWTEDIITLPNSASAPFYQVAFKGKDGYGYGVKLDDIIVSAASNCPRPEQLDATTTNATAHLFWYGNSDEYQIEYNEIGDTNVILVTSLTENVDVTGLTSMTSYQYRVRGICGNDTTRWSVYASFTTALCATEIDVFSYDSTMTGITSQYGPMGFSYYNYAYTQTIIDSAHLADLSGDITAIAFSTPNGNAGSYYNHMDIYLSNISESVFATHEFITPDSVHEFVKVVDDGDLRYSDGGWHYVVLDTNFAWDGHSNILVSVNRRHGAWGSGATFNAHSTTGVRTVYAYNDGSAYDPTDLSNAYVYFDEFVGDLMFVSCSDGCDAPRILSTSHDYESATITWSGSGTSYEVAIMPNGATTWPAETAVTGNTYTFTGLMPATTYQYRVRQDCSVDELGYSNWTIGTFTTDSLPCLAPSAIVVSDITNADATVAWTANGNETNWEIHVWATGVSNQNFVVSTNPASVNGLVAGVTYSVAVRALCGTMLVEGDWSDTVTFNTLTCPDVTGLATSNVTFNSVDLSWNANAMAQGYVIEYGFAGFNQGQGATVNVNTNSYTVTGLTDETNYDFYVRAVCGTDWYSESWAHVSAMTAQLPEDVVTLTLLVNDPAMGTVSGAGSYAAGTTVSFSATANAGYQFVNWSDGNTEASRSIVLNENMTLTANFASVEGIDVVNGASCTIYPNPATSAATISVAGVNGKVRISVVDMNGRVVATDMLECNADCVKTMDVDNLAQGAYFVRITGENVNMVKKLVVR